MKLKKGVFISFEGPEASGKSTQLKLLKKYFIKNKIPHLITREPGGTEISEKLRKIILNKKNNITSTEELLLLMASRLNHVNNVIIPALSQSKIVISDRFADSTFVYQGYVNNFGMNKTMRLHKELINNFLPSKTFLFNLSPDKILKRLKKRKISNKYDKIDINFHKKVINGYRKLSKTSKRFVVIDAEKDFQIINKTIISILNL